MVVAGAARLVVEDVFCPEERLACAKRDDTVCRVQSTLFGDVPVSDMDVPRYVPEGEADGSARERLIMGGRDDDVGIWRPGSPAQSVRPVVFGEAFLASKEILYGVKDLMR